MQKLLVAFQLALLVGCDGPLQSPAASSTEETGPPVPGKHFAEIMKSLDELHASLYPLVPPDLANLDREPPVRVYCNHQFRPESASKLIQLASQLAEVRQLDIGGVGLPDEVLTRITDLPLLGSVSLALNGNSPQAIAELSKLEHLDGLWVEDEWISEATAEAVSKLDNIGELHIRANPQVSVKAMSHIARMKNLRELEIARYVSPWRTSDRFEPDWMIGKGITSPAARQLAGCESLLGLSIEGSIDDETIRLLAQSSKLVHVRVNSSACSQDAVADLLNAPSTKLVAVGPTLMPSSILDLKSSKRIDSACTIMLLDKTTGELHSIGGASRAPQAMWFDHSDTHLFAAGDWFLTQYHVESGRSTSVGTDLPGQFSISPSGKFWVSGWPIALNKKRAPQLRVSIFQPPFKFHDVSLANELREQHVEAVSNWVGNRVVILAGGVLYLCELNATLEIVEQMKVTGRARVDGISLGTISATVVTWGGTYLWRFADETWHVLHDGPSYGAAFRDRRIYTAIAQPNDHKSMLTYCDERGGPLASLLTDHSRSLSLQQWRLDEPVLYFSNRWIDFGAVNLETGKLLFHTQPHRILPHRLQHNIENHMGGIRAIAVGKRFLAVSAHWDEVTHCGVQ